MNAKSLHKMGLDDLLALFVELALKQDNALFDNDTPKVTRLFWRIEEVKNELKSRPGDQRRALIALFDHPNPQVRLKAAKATLALTPEAARGVLESLAKTCLGPQQLDAGMCLWRLDEGAFKPT